MDVVLVVDMINGFMDPNAPLYCGNKAREIIPNIQKLLKDYEATNPNAYRTLYICDQHETIDAEFQLFSPHCIKGTKECEVTPELIDPVLKVSYNFHYKNTYSAFSNPKLESFLDRLLPFTPNKIVICGVCTDICVLHTTLDAVRRGYKVEVREDCVASFNEEAHKWALDHMEKVLGVKVIRSSKDRATLDFATLKPGYYWYQDYNDRQKGRFSIIERQEDGDTYGIGTDCIIHKEGLSNFIPIKEPELREVWTTCCCGHSAYEHDATLKCNCCCCTKYNGVKIYA